MKKNDALSQSSIEESVDFNKEIRSCIILLNNTILDDFDSFAQSMCANKDLTKNIGWINDTKDLFDKLGKHEEDLFRTRASEILYYGSICFEEINLKQLGNNATIDDYLWLDVACESLIRVLKKGESYNKLRAIQIKKQLLAKTQMLDPLGMNGTYILSQYAVADIEKYLMLLNEILTANDEEEVLYLQQSNSIMQSYEERLNYLLEIYDLNRLLTNDSIIVAILFCLALFRLGEMLGDKKQCLDVSTYLSEFISRINKNSSIAPKVIEFFCVNWIELFNKTLNYRGC